MVNSEMTVTLFTGKARVNNTIPPRIYTVKKGDSLYKIARRIYGDGALWQTLYENNRAVLAHPCLLSEGMVLNL